MSAHSWWKWEITPGNVVSWVISIVTVVAIIIWLQADVRALQKEDATLDRRLSRVEDQTEKDRQAVWEMRGDIRVIRQILEGQQNGPR